MFAQLNPHSSDFGDIVHKIPLSCTSSPCNLLSLNLGIYSLVQATVGVGAVLIGDFCVGITGAGVHVNCCKTPGCRLEFGWITADKCHVKQLSGIYVLLLALVGHALICPPRSGRIPQFVVCEIVLLHHSFPLRQVTFWDASAMHESFTIEEGQWQTETIYFKVHQSVKELKKVTVTFKVFGIAVQHGIRHHCTTLFCPDAAYNMSKAKTTTTITLNGSNTPRVVTQHQHPTC